MDLVVRALLTYLLHSTVLLASAALLHALLRARRLALQEAVLRAALVGGFVTASLQIGVGIQPLAGVLRLPEASAPGRPALSPRRVAPAVETRLPASRPALGPAFVPRRQASVTGSPAAPQWRTWVVPAPSASAAVADWTARLAGAWKQALAIAWAALALLGLSRLAVALVRLGRLLRDRQPMREGELTSRAATVADALGLRRSVRLSAAPRLAVPLATGVLRPEVCLPSRAVTELGADEQIALCAHELAHVARRDPAWILLARALEALAPLQPLNIWARRRLQDLAECLSDDLAVDASACRLGLARSLVDVASWTLGGHVVFPVVAAGAFGARSRLGQRVERLMDPVRTLERPRRILLPLAAAAVLATAILTPVVSGYATPSDEPQAVPAAPPVPPAPAAMPAPPAPAAQPAPPALPARPAPVARPAPAPRPAPPSESAPELEAEGDGVELENRLEQLSEQIAERAKLNDDEMREIEQKIEALASGMKPDDAEIRKLTSQIDAAANELAASVTGDAGKDATQQHRDRTRAAARRVAELEDQLREATKELRVPEQEIHALAAKARELAEKAKPTPEEMQEIRRLSQQTAHAVRDSMPSAEEIARLTREAAEQAREAMRQVKDELLRAHDELRRAREEVRHEREQHRERAERRERDEQRRGREDRERTRSEQPPPPPQR